MASKMELETRISELESRIFELETRISSGVNSGNSRGNNFQVSPDRQRELDDLDSAELKKKVTLIVLGGVNMPDPENPDGSVVERGVAGVQQLVGYDNLSNKLKIFIRSQIGLGNVMVTTDGVQGDVDKTKKFFLE